MAAEIEADNGAHTYWPQQNNSTACGGETFRLQLDVHLDHYQQSYRDFQLPFFSDKNWYFKVLERIQFMSLLLPTALNTSRCGYLIHKGAYVALKMPANLYPKINLGKMEVINDSYWRKRKQRLEKMLEEFQKTGWKTGGFNVYNCESLRRRLYQDNRKYTTKIHEMYDTSLSEGVLERITPLGHKYNVLPEISHSTADWHLEQDGVVTPESVDMSKYNDVFRRTGAEVTYFRKYEKDGGEEILLRSEKFDPLAKIGSLDNAHHKPGGGNVKIIHKPINLKTVKSKVGSLDNRNHIAKGGKRKVPHHDISWQAKSKVGSLDNIDYQPSHGNISPVFHQTPKWHSQSKVGSLENIGHMPTRSFRTLQDYMSPFRQRLLNKPNVIWTEGYNQNALSKPLKKLSPLASRSPNCSRVS